MDAIENLCLPRRANFAHYDFTRQEIDNLLNIAMTGTLSFWWNDSDIKSADADSPRPFTGDALLRSVEATADMMNVSEHVETLLIRLRSLLADKQMKAVIGDSGDLTLEKWLTDYIGADKSENGCLAVIDLSLVPSRDSSCCNRSYRPYDFRVTTTL